MVIPEPADKLLYSNVVPAPTTPIKVLAEPTDVKPVPPLVVANVPDTCESNIILETDFQATPSKIHSLPFCE